jgi:hypothetical protein
VTPIGNATPVAPPAGLLAAGEKHLHSFVIYPMRLEARGGFLLKLTAYYHDNTRFYLHLTDRRLLIVPHPHSPTESLVMRGFIGILAAALGGAADVGKDLAEADLERGAKLMEAARGTFGSLPYGQVARVETFAQGLGTLVRLVPKGRAGQELVFTVRGAQQAEISFGCPAEFVAEVRRLVAAAGR